MAVDHLKKFWSPPSDDKLDTLDETLLVELDKVDSLESIPSTFDDKVDTFDETVLVELETRVTFVDTSAIVDDKLDMFLIA